MIHDTCGNDYWVGFKTIVKSNSSFVMVFIVILSWLIYVINKTAVPFEGWYVTYADMILSGKVPYVDFELVLPPLYSYLCALMVLLFGDHLIAFRILGTIVCLVTILVMYLTLKKLFPAWISAVGTLLAFFVLQTKDIFITYDYIRFYDLFNILSLYLIIVVAENFSSRKKNEKNVLLCGIVLSTSIMFRQTSGILVTLTIIVCMFVLLWKYNPINKKKLLSMFITGIVFPLFLLLLYLIVSNSFVPFIEMTIGSGTKGSICNMLFSWLLRFQFMELLIGSTVGIIIASILWKFEECCLNEQRGYNHFIVFLSIITSIFIFALYYTENLVHIFTSFWVDLRALLFFITISIGLYLLIKIVKESEWNVARLLIIECIVVCCWIFATNYGSGTSAGLDFGQSCFSYAFVSALLLLIIQSVNKEQWKKILTVSITVLICLLILSSVAVKVNTPIYWWGISSCEYKNCTETIDVDYFAGIVTDDQEKNMYEDFLRKTQYLSEDDLLYCYAQIPIFYTIAGKIPFVKAPIVWFDVCRDSTAISDLELLKEKLPKVIMFADHGEYVLEAHERAYRDGQPCGQRYIYEWIKESMFDGTYIIGAEYVVHGYPYYLLFRA